MQLTGYNAKYKKFNFSLHPKFSRGSLLFYGETKEMSSWGMQSTVNLLRVAYFPFCMRECYLISTKIFKASGMQMRKSLVDWYEDFC